MTEINVIKILGQPLAKNCDEQLCYWKYTLCGEITEHYDRREILFDKKKGIVDYIFNEFYAD